MRERAGRGRVFIDRENNMWKNFKAGVCLPCFKAQGEGECGSSGRYVMTLVASEIGKYPGVKLCKSW